MAKNIPLSTIGIRIGYKVETASDARDGKTPAKGDYTHIHGIYSTPDFNAAPSTADATSFDNEEYTTKISLLKEIPDNLEFGVRLGQAFVDEWDDLITAYETGIKSQFETWFMIDIPELDKSIFFTGKPLKLGLPSMEANSGIDMTAYISPTGEPQFIDDVTTGDDKRVIAEEQNK